MYLSLTPTRGFMKMISTACVGFVLWDDSVDVLAFFLCFTTIVQAQCIQIHHLESLISNGEGISVPY
jgi:hypothetical protein